MILQYFKKKENEYKIKADLIYIKILTESKFLIQNKFFTEKNFTATFEIISILLILQIKLYNEPNNIKKKYFKQELIKNFIIDLDKSLRDIGIGDMSIGKYVKKYVKKFYYRVKVLDPLLDSSNIVMGLEGYLKTINIVDSKKINKLSLKLVNISKSLIS